MKIAVCVKWVPVVARMKFDPETKRVIREGVPNELNAYDLLAVQRAVELKESHGAEVSVFTMGPPGARDGLVRCLALGADHAYHIMDAALAGSDTLATSRALALALSREQYDLLLFGNNSVDAETGQVGPEVAELLGLPQVTGVEQLDMLEGGRVRAVRTLDDGTQVVECPLPALVSVTEGVAPEINPTRDEIKAVADRPITEISASDLSDDLSIFGAEGSPTWVSEIRIVESTREQRVIEDAAPEDAAAQVVAYLKERGVLDPALRGAKHVRLDALPAARPLEGPETWVLVEHGMHGLRAVSLELLGAAQAVADAIEGPVVAVLLGGADVERYVPELCCAGADVVAVAADERLASYTTEAYTATLSAAIQERRPYAVLLPSTANGRDLAARVAGRLKLGLTGDCIGLEVDAEGRLVQLKPAFGGNVVAPIYSKTLPNLATVRPGLLEPLEPNNARPPVRTDLPVFAPAEPAVRVVESIPVDTGDASDLETAWSVVCIGMGLGGPERIAELEPLRKVLDARFVITRDVAEHGWLPKQLQVGITGRSIAPDLYIGVGVRGDFNHTVGIQRAGTVIAVNNNRRATIFRQVDLGVVGDLHEFIPALTKALAQELAD
ncbi:MAG: FAD-binding protein [Dehalococcoidia bacterium]